MSASNAGELRRYLLGELDEETCAALEQEYFARRETFDRVWNAEHDLIDDYLDDRLTPDERARFERHYLATPDHQARLAIARELIAAAAASGAAEPTTSWRSSAGVFLRWPTVWQAVAVAALVLIAVGGAWTLRSRTVPRTTELAPSPSPIQNRAGGRAPEQSQPGERPGEPVTAPRAPIVVAVSLPPISVRGADEVAALIIPPGTDRVVLRLQSEPNGPALGRGITVVRTVAGAEVWRGPAVPERGVPPSARVEMPANTLPPDDYIVALFEGANGRESEMSRYFLRVRAR